MLLLATLWRNNNAPMAFFCGSALAYKTKTIYTSSIHTESISCATADNMCKVVLLQTALRLSKWGASSAKNATVHQIAVNAAGTTTASSYGYDYTMLMATQCWGNGWTPVTISYIMQLTTAWMAITGIITNRSSCIRMLLWIALTLTADNIDR